MGVDSTGADRVAGALRSPSFRLFISSSFRLYHTRAVRVTVTGQPRRLAAGSWARAAAVRAARSASSSGLAHTLMAHAPQSLHTM